MAFEFKLHTSLKSQEKILYTEAHKRIEKLAKRFNAITGSRINITSETKSKTPYLFRASVVIKTKPKNITSIKKDKNPQTALKDALDAVERQLTELIAKMQRPWEKPTKTKK